MAADGAGVFHLLQPKTQALTLVFDAQLILARCASECFMTPPVAIRAATALGVPQAETAAPHGLPEVRTDPV